MPWWLYIEDLENFILNSWSYARVAAEVYTLKRLWFLYSLAQLEDDILTQARICHIKMLQIRIIVDDSVYVLQDFDFLFLRLLILFFFLTLAFYICADGSWKARIY